MVECTLLLLKDGVPLLPFKINQRTYIGRSSECEIQLLDTRLSRKHVCIFQVDESFWIKDLDSKNGTLLNDTPLVQKKMLVDGDLICLGNASLVFNPDMEMYHTRYSDKRFVITHDPATALEIAELQPAGPDEISAKEALALHATAVELTGQLDMEAVLKTTLNLMLGQFKAERGFILLKNSRGGFEPKVVISDTETAAISTNIIKKVCETKRPLLLGNALGAVSFAGKKSVLEHRLCSVMIAPIIKDEHVVGICQVDRQHQNAFNSKSLLEFQLLSLIAGVAISNAQKYQKQTQKSDAMQIGDRMRRMFIGNHSKTVALLKLIQKAGASQARVLITGESGTGKELVAKLIHEQSSRKIGPYVPVNCAALPENLLESELFGHEKGAFTGASKQKKGLFELADGGTLFLDEVGEMPLSVQVKLLRVIQEGIFMRVGGERAIAVDVRIVAATNKDLAGAIQKKEFREDLFFRLNVVNLEVLPLRERREDIVLLVKHFISRFAAEVGKKPPMVSDGAMKLMMAYHWPGNVRELQNITERLIVLGEGPKIKAEDVSGYLAAGKPVCLTPGNLKEAVAQTERMLIIETLNQTKRNKSATCRILGISRPTLDKKLTELAIEETL